MTILSHKNQIMKLP